MGWLFGKNKTSMVSPGDAIPGRAARMAAPARHMVLDVPPAPPYPEGSEIADFGLGCFWGAERVFWQTPGVVTTSVGYSVIAPPELPDHITSALRNAFDATMKDPAFLAAAKACCADLNPASHAAVAAAVAKATNSPKSLLERFIKATGS